MEKLLVLTNEKNAKFVNKIIPNSKPSLGIYTKDIKQIAKEYVNNKNYDFLRKEHIYHEEDMIHVYMLTYLKDVNLVYTELEYIIPKLNNWAMCDSLVCGLKIVKKNKDIFMDLINKYRWSTKEYEIRFSLIMLLAHYCNVDYFECIKDVIETCKKDDYYVKMGIAWLLCECVIKIGDEAIEYLKIANIDKWTHNKAIQKMIESYRISEDVKKILRENKW